jgi:phosphoglycerol transferase
LIAGLAGSLNRKTLRPLTVAVILIGVTCTAVFVNFLPTFVNIYRHGNVGVAERNLAGPEIYGLKISQLLLPVTGHRIDYLRQKKELYNKFTNITENDAASLGVIGSIGFLALIALLFYRPRRTGNNPCNALLTELSILNISAVLLATIGGIGSLFALVVSPAIRSYNRISVFIAFFALFAVAIGADYLYRRQRTSRARLVFCLVAGLVVLGGILDQTTKGFVPEYAWIKEEFRSDHEFVLSIEGSLPAGSMIFQLPYIPFPESPPVNKMVDYDHLRGYLHSRTLRWSYGAMKNREGDLWQQRVTAMPLEEFVQTLCFAGFSGIYIDRNGYEDTGTAMLSELSKLLQVKPLNSPNGRLVFLSLTDYTRALHEKYPDSEWQTKQDLSLHPLMIEWTGGFSGLEVSPAKSWRWCSSEGELRFSNTSQHARKVNLEMSFASGYQEYDDLIMSGVISEQIKTNASPTPYSKTITLPPGESVIKFTSTAQRINAPLDPRILVFRIENFNMRSVE